MTETSHQNENTYKKLYRSKTDRMMAGICGGIGGYFNIDPSFIRIACVLLFFAGGITFFAYLIMWFIVPLEPSKKTCDHCKTDNQDSNNQDSSASS